MPYPRELTADDYHELDKIKDWREMLIRHRMLTLGITRKEAIELLQLDK